MGFAALYPSYALHLTRRAKPSISATVGDDRQGERLAESLEYHNMTFRRPEIFCECAHPGSA
jgi:hypothetical protein